MIREQGTNKLSIIGSFTSYNTAGFPFMAPAFVVTVLLTNLQGPLERYPIAVRFESSISGHVIASSVAEIAAGERLARNEVIAVPIGMAPIHYPEPGVYNVVVLANNEAIGKRQLTARTLTSA